MILETNAGELGREAGVYEATSVRRSAGRSVLLEKLGALEKQ
jgi:hypothetical protein